MEILKIWKTAIPKSSHQLATVAMAVLLWAPHAQAAQTVTLAWNPGSASGIAGYRVHYGTSSGNYTQTSDVGNTTTATVASLTGGTTYFFAVTDYNSAGTESSPSNEVTFTASASASATASLFSASATPATVTVSDHNSVELGCRFQASTSGKITGIRFYKGPQNVGTHVGNLWSSTGTLLASATFSSESASGWQQVNLANPVSVTSGTTYIVSYHTQGYYSADANYFNTSRTNGYLTAPASAASGGNGLYAYGTSSSFPKNTYNATNYWVDVVFAPGL